MRRVGRVVRHIVWDWNGTLLHDVEVVVRTMNETLAALGLEPVTVEQYRAAYCRPVRTFYGKLIGRDLTDTEWLRLDAEFHDLYHVRAKECVLTADAVPALDGWRAYGGSQSLLSMYHHEQLVALVDEHGISSYFDRVDGSRGGSGDHKAEHLVRHLHELSIDPVDVILVGDSVDDAAAARHVGAQCVLYAGGFHDAAGLAAAGATVAETLTEAVGQVRLMTAAR